MQSRVFRLVHDPHAAATQLFKDAVVGNGMANHSRRSLRPQNMQVNEPPELARHLFEILAETSLFHLLTLYMKRHSAPNRPPLLKLVASINTRCPSEVEKVLLRFSPGENPDSEVGRGSLPGEAASLNGKTSRGWVRRVTASGCERCKDDVTHLFWSRFQPLLPQSGLAQRGLSLTSTITFPASKVDPNW